MSKIDTYASIQLQINSEEAKNKLRELQKDANNLRKEIDELHKAEDAGDKEAKKRIKVLNKELKQKNAEIRAMKSQTQNLNDVLAQMSDLTPKELQRTMKSITAELNSGRVKRGSDEWKALTDALRRCKTEMAKINEEMREARSLSDRFADWGNKWMGIVMTIDGGLQAVSGMKSTMQDSVQAYADMQEAESQVIKYTGMTKEEVADLNEEFKRMDTRTSRERLNALAGDAGKLGITGKQQILEFVDAADKINVALGEDLGDDAVKNIGKLAQMFGEDKTKGLRGAMLATGSAINEVAQNSSAAEAYLVEFTARVAGAAKQANISQADILGYASVLDENMLRDETAATAFQNIMLKMFQKPELFAKIARVNTEEFTKTMKEDANKAMLQFIQSLSDRGNLAELAPIFDKMKLDGQGAASVLAVMAGKIDDVRERQALANQAYEDATSIINEFNVQNNTVQGRLDKNKKQFNDLRVELGERLLPVMSAGISMTSTSLKVLKEVIDFTLKHKVAIAMATGAIVFYTAAVNAAVIADKLKVFWTGKVVTSLNVLKATIAKNPLGILLVAVSSVVGLLIEWASKQEEVNDATQRMNDLSKKTSDEVNNERSRIETLTKIVRDNNVSLNKRREALEALKKIAPGYHAELTTEGELIKDNKEALDSYLANLEKEIRLKNIQAELEKTITEKQEKEKEIENFEKEAQQASAMMRNPDSHTFKNMFLVWTEGSKAYHKAAELDKNYNKLKNKLQTEKQELEKYEEELMAEFAAYSEDTNPTTVVTGGGGEDDPDKDIAYADARRQKINKLNEQAQKQRIEAKMQYAAGILDYTEYQDRIYQIDLDNIQQRLALYKDHESEYGSIMKELQKLDEERQKQANAWSLAQIQRETDEQLAALRLKHASGSVSEQAYQDELDRIELEGLKRRAEYQRQWGNPDEAYKAEEQYLKAVEDKKLARQAKFLQQVKQMQDQYLKSSAEEQMQFQLDTLEQMHQAGLLAEEEYQRMLAIIRMQGARNIKSESDSKTSQILTDAGYTAPGAAGSSGDALSGAIVSMGQWVALEKQNEAALQKIKEMEEAGVITHQEAANAMAEIDKNRFNSFVSAAQAAYGIVNALMASASSYMQAAMDAEVAKVEQRYDAEIERAGNNQTKVTQLEEQKEKEIAAIKNQYNRKAMVMELSQAVASTAMAAINAYASAAAVPVIGHILAPIAAAAAVAAGTLQIATIKKQHEAQATGYYEGGFTRPGKRREPAGVVHAGEFVVNADGVRNPNVLPLLHFLDQAQRNNTIGSLTAADVSRAVTAPVVTSAATSVTASAPALQVVDDGRTRQAVERLNRQLEQPITAVVQIDGEDGFDRQYTRFQQLKKRK